MQMSQSFGCWKDRRWFWEPWLGMMHRFVLLRIEGREAVLPRPSGFAVHLAQSRRPDRVAVYTPSLH